MLNPHPVQVIAVTGGKGGVGKTNVSVNLAMSAAANGKDVVLFDADLGLANIDVMLGLYPKHTLRDVMEGQMSLEEIIIEGPAGIKIIPAASGIQDMAQLTQAQHAGLIQAFSELSLNVDMLIVDTAAGISDSVISFCQASQEVLVVVCDEPASLTDAYALIKLLNREHGVQRFRILSNMAKSAQQGRHVYENLSKVTERFLDVTLDYVGHIPYDDYVLKAVKKQRAVVEAFPRSKAASAYKTLSDKVCKWPIRQLAGGHLEFFVERLIQGNMQTDNLEVMP